MSQKILIIKYELNEPFNRIQLPKGVKQESAVF